MSGSIFQSLLQRAYWRGIPFEVDAQEVEKGRKVALHDYPFRDGGWAEDMGRKLRGYRFTGHLVGDAAPLLQLALDAACEAPGPGLLVHPTLGALTVTLVGASSSVHKERMRVISVDLAFVEQGSSLFPSVLTDTVNAVASAAADALASIGEYIAGASIVLAAAAAAASLAEAAAVTFAFSGACLVAAADPGALVALATALPPPDAATSYGRYASGSAPAALPPASTVASLQAQVAAGRAACSAAAAAAQAAAAGFDAATAATAVAALSALVEAARATMLDPAGQVRTIAGLGTFAYADANAAGAGLRGDAALVRDAFAAACRRAALVSLALAAAAYRPSSYDDAAALRAQVAAALDVEVTAAGDAGDDGAYAGLKALRAAVIADLTARGAALPLVARVALPSNLPSLAVAFRLYRDGTRGDEVAAEVGCPHPAFLPTSIRVLAT